MCYFVDMVIELEFVEILVEFICQYFVVGQLVVCVVFFLLFYLVVEEELLVLLESIKQNGDYVDIVCLMGSKDDYYYLMQVMSENYVVMFL